MSEFVGTLSTRAQLTTLMSEGGPTAMIDFWADWCAPCKAMGPHFDAVAEAFKDEPIEFYKLNTEKHPDLAASFHVRSLPTLVLIHDGKIIDALIGSKDGQTLAKKADWLLSKARGDGFFDRLFGKKKA